MTFVGRLAEQQALFTCVSAAIKGQAQVVLVEGAAGIGKSSLVRRFLAALERVTVLAAHADEAEADLPFAVAQQLLNRAGTPHPIAAGPMPDPLAVGAALLDAVAPEHVAELTVVVVEDAHWADGPSLQALTFALRRIGDLPVLSLFTFRPDAASRIPHGLRQLTGDTGVSLTLSGLDASELQELGAGHGRQIGPRLAERLHEHTGGNPLYAQAILDEIPPDALSESGRGPIPAPSTFGAVVLAKLASCSRDCDELVAAAAVAGEECRIEEALRIAGLDSAFPAVDDAVGARLLEIVSTSTADHLRFPHPLIRAAIYHDLSPGRRSRLHQAAAELAGDARVALRHRVAAAYGPDDELAHSVEALATEEVARGAWVAAGASFLSASRLSSRRADTERRFLFAIGAAIAAGERNEAVRLHEQTADFAETAFGKYIAGTLAGMELRSEDARSLLHSAWDDLDPETAPDLATRIASRLASEYLTTSQTTEAVRWSRRALQGCRGGGIPGDDPVTLHLMTLGVAGRIDEATALLGAHPGLVVNQPGKWPSGLLGRGALKLWTDDLAGARDDLAAVAETSMWSGPSSLRLLAMLFLAETDFRTGAWDDAVTRAQVAMSVATDGQLVDILAMANAVLAMPLAARAEAEAAQALVTATFQALPEGGSSPAAARAFYARGLLADALGDFEEAVAAIGLIGQIARAPGVFESGVLPWRESLAVGLVRVGRLDEAADEIDALDKMAAQRQLRSAKLGATRARALLEAARGDGEAAAAAFATAEQLAGGLEMPFTRALIDLDHGAFLRRNGQRKEAAVRLECARQTFTQLRAPTYTQRADAELAACDVGSRRQRDVAPSQLTPAELSVAHLIAEGSSNRQAASALALSVRTVETHLGRIYRKLGLSSRAQLAARFARDGADAHLRVSTAT